MPGTASPTPKGYIARQGNSLSGFLVPPFPPSLPFFSGFLWPFLFLSLSLSLLSPHFSVPVPLCIALCL